MSATTRPVPEKSWFGGQLTAKLKEIEYPWAKSTGGQRNDVGNYVRRFCPNWCFLQLCPVRQHTPTYDWRSPDRTGQRRIPQRHHFDPQTFGLASLGAHPAPRPQLPQSTRLDDRRFSLDTNAVAASIARGSRRSHQPRPRQVRRRSLSVALLQSDNLTLGD